MKREIPIAMTMLAGLIVTAAFFSKAPWLQAANAELLSWALIFFSVAFLLGIGNLFRINLKQIAMRHPDWPYKAILLITLSGYLILGLLEIEGFIVYGDGSLGNKVYQDWIHGAVFKPLQATMFSLLAFYIASAAFRAFRARSFEATLLLGAGAVVMLAQVPLPIPGGSAIGSIVQPMQHFLMAFVNTAGQKAIIMGAALGVLATGLRIVLGIERSYLSE